MILCSVSLYKSQKFFHRAVSPFLIKEYNLTYICSKSFLLDGRPQWEVEAKIIREKSQGVSSLCFSCTDIVQHFVCNNRTILNLSVIFLFLY